MRSVKKTLLIRPRQESRPLYIGQQDIRCYRPPLGYSAIAELIEYHPLTKEQFAQSVWRILLTRRTRHDRI